MSRLSLGNVLEAWQGVALEDLRPEIHRYAQAMKYAEIRSQKARKSLTIMLQCLKQTQVSESDTSVINKAVSGTIKSFQKEVDELTQRSSFAEACFLQIYSKFYEAPDPVPVLSKALIEMQKLQDFKSEQGKKQNLILESDHRLTRSVEGEVSGDNILAQAKKFELEKSRLLEESQLRENLLQQELQKCRDLLSKTQAQLDDIQSRFVMFHNRKENEEASRVQFSNSINEELLILKSQLAAMKHENMTLKESLSSDLNDNTVTAEVKRRIADLQQQLGQLLKNYNLCLQENETLRQQLIKYANNKIMFEQSHQAEVKLLQSKIESLNDAFRLLQSSDKSNALQQQNKMRQEAEGNAQEGEFANCIEARVNKSEESRPNSSWMQLEEPSAKDDNTLTGDPPRTTASALSGFGSSNRSGAKDFFSFQRDRYRKALESMEIEKSTLQCRNESLIQQLKVLKSDNENLFLRLKAAHSSNKNRGNDLEHGNLLENKYAKIVAERENPFSKFALSRGQSQLNAMEKLMLIGTKICLGRRSLRTASFLYIAALHALVFFSLLTHTVIPHCPQNTKP